MNAPDVKRARKQAFEANKLLKRLRRQVGQAIADYDMIRAGDRVMVCMSGGKDSYGLLDILMKLREHAPRDFEIVAVNLDQRHPGFPEHVLPDYLSALGIPYKVVVQDTYSVVKRVIPEGKTMCSLCSRLRRGVLYRVAREIGATRIALGHHRDDILATFFLNLFFGGRLKAMPPKLVSDDGHHVVIRPLAYVRERDLAAHAAARGFPIIPCDLCGSQENLQRQQVKSHAASSGRSASPGASRPSSTRSPTWRRRTCSMPDCSISAGWRQPAQACADGDIAFDATVLSRTRSN